MNALLRKPMTLESFLAWEDRQPLRHEFDGIRAIAMTGGTEAHAPIQVNLRSPWAGACAARPAALSGTT
jgi:hypothetical protein